MARRNDHSKDELRQLTLKAVRDFLAIYPPQDMSLRKIAKLIGYSPATIINNFGSYGDLLLAVNAETLDELHALSASAIRDESHALDKSQALGQNQAQVALRKLARVYLAYARKYPYRWHLAFEHRIAGQTTLPAWQKNRIDRLFALFTEQLSRTGARKSLQELHIASRVVWAGVHGICLLAAGGGVVQENNATGEQMLDMFLTGFLQTYTQTTQTAQSTMAPVRTTIQL